MNNSTKKQIYTISGLFQGGGFSHTNSHFLFPARCLFSPFSKISDSWGAQGPETLQVNDFSLPATVRQLQSCHENLTDNARSECTTHTPGQSCRPHSQRNSTKYLYSSFSNGYSLLLHCFMNGYLIPHVHFVKFINATHTLQWIIKSRWLISKTFGAKESLRQSGVFSHQLQQFQGCRNWVPGLTLSANISAPASMTNSCDSSSFTTAAVRPAALEAFPLVYTARGLNSSTCLWRKATVQNCVAQT